jgi:hypothetical protein
MNIPQEKPTRVCCPCGEDHKLDAAKLRQKRNKVLAKRAENAAKLTV